MYLQSRHYIIYQCVITFTFILHYYQSLININKTITVFSLIHRLITVEW